MNQTVTKKSLHDSAKLQTMISAAALATNSAADSPQTRSAILTLLKQAMSEGRGEAERRLIKNGDGRMCAKYIANLQDSLISAIFNFAVTQVYVSENRSKAEQLAITAVGGYGRGLLAPGSDIDLLFVLPYKQTVWGEQVVEYILYFLWDLGLKVGHATRDIDECIRQSKADMTVRTSILEARFIDGDKTLFAEMAKRFDQEIVQKTASEFISAKLLERDLRHKKTGESRYLVEPNIKDGKGGLRDLHTLYWIGKYQYRVKTDKQLVKVGLFNEDEYKRFQRASKFLWTVRCHMHFLAGRAEERLSFDIQRDMAERLNYISRGGMLDVERFMKHYFLTAKEVGDLTLAVCAQLEEDRAKAVTGINGLIRSIRFPRKKISGSLDFINDHGRINVADSNVFKRDPTNLIRLFKLADDNNLDIHPDAVTLITRSLKLVDKNLRNNEEANRLFVDIASSPNRPDILLRKMNETGILGKFIPSFGRIVAMMQFNMYHHYTVDEHLIRSVGVLSGIESGKLVQQHPLSSELLPDVKDRVILYIALLLHDIAKGRKEDHSIAGARIAKSLCPRLGFTHQQTELVAWLVREHLTMSLVAQSRDLSDRKTISDFAAVVQTVERMRYLLMLTVCDIRAVGPGVWNGWKGQLLRTLYFETEPLLTGGYSKLDRRGRLEQSKAALEELLDGWSKSDKKRILALLYPAYFLSTPIEDQVRHMNFIRRADSEKQSLATGIHSLAFEEITEITVLSRDHPALLSIIAGACSAAGANIVDARIHTTSDGRAFDSIFINREFEREFDELRRAERLCETIRNALAGTVQLSDMIASAKPAKASSRAFKIKPRAEINNDLSEQYSVIEVEGLDRPGVLSKITRAIADLNLNIGSAHIATFGEKIIDSFYVTDLIGQKIALKSRKQKIIETLTQVMESVSPSEKKSRKSA